MHCRDIADDEPKQREKRDQPDRADRFIQNVNAKKLD